MPLCDTVWPHNPPINSFDHKQERTVLLQPPWRAPHSFERLQVGVSVTNTPYVFTFGITLTELARADSLVDARLCDRVGLPWLIDLNHAIAPHADAELNIALGEARHQDAR
jgi:hypothetical protein